MFAAIASISGGNFLWYWGEMSKAMYFMIGAPCHIGALLLFLLKIEVTYACGFGVALYYGTIFLGGFIGDMMIENEWSYVAAFVIVSLLCYIFWIKQAKEE